MFRVLTIAILTLLSGSSLWASDHALQDFRRTVSTVQTNADKDYYWFQDSFESSSPSLFVYLVEDIPLDLKAQINATRAFYFLIHHIPFDALLTESAEGPISYADFQNELTALFPDSAKRAEHLKQMLGAGKLNAVGYYQMSQSFPMPMMGVDDQEQYQQQVQRYTSLVKTYQGLHDSLQTLRQEVNERWRLLTNSPYQRFVRKRRLRQGPGYWQLTLDEAQNQGVPLQDYVSLTTYVGLMRNQAQINPKDVQKELALLRSELIRFHSDQLKQTLKLSSVDNDIQKIIQSLLFAQTFESTLMATLHRNALLKPDLWESFLLTTGVNQRNYQSLTAFVAFLKRLAQVNLWQVEQDKRSLEHALKEHLIKDTAEKNLWELDRVCEALMHGCRGQLDLFLQPQSIQSFAELKPYAVEIESLRRDLLGYEALAEQRSEWLSQNILDYSSRNSCQHVLVFATDYNLRRLQSIFREMNVSYLVIRPLKGGEAY